MHPSIEFGCEYGCPHCVKQRAEIVRLRDALYTETNRKRLDEANNEIARLRRLLAAALKDKKGE